MVSRVGISRVRGGSGLACPSRTIASRGANADRRASSRGRRQHLTSLQGAALLGLAGSALLLTDRGCILSCSRERPVGADGSEDAARGPASFHKNGRTCMERTPLRQAL